MDAVTKKGLKKMRVSKVVDWLSATQPVSDITEFNNIIPDGFRLGKRLPPNRYYKNRWELKPAGSYAYSVTGTISQKIELTGSEMLTARECGFSDISLINHAIATCTHFTRLDYAVDIHDTSLEAKDFLLLWQMGKFNTRTRKCHHETTESDMPETTVYFGSELSEAMLRVYDKSGQMKLLNEAWLRVELQTRDRKADTLARDMARVGLTGAGDQMLKNTYACNAVPALHEALSDVELDLTPIPRKETSWRKWMNTQVFDSIVNHAAEPEDLEFIADWLMRLKSATML